MVWTQGLFIQVWCSLGEQGNKVHTPTAGTVQQGNPPMNTLRQMGQLQISSLSSTLTIAHWISAPRDKWCD